MLWLHFHTTAPPKKENEQNDGCVEGPGGSPHPGRAGRTRGGFHHPFPDLGDLVTIYSSDEVMMKVKYGSLHVLIWQSLTSST